MFGMGTWEIALVLVIALLVLGPDKLPGVARSIGKGLREMRRATNDLRVHMELDNIPDEPRVQTAPPPELNNTNEAQKTAPELADKVPASPVSDVSPRTAQKDKPDD